MSFWGGGDSLIAQLEKNAGDPSSILGSRRSAGEGIGYPLQYSWASLVAQLVKNPPAMWETWVWSWVGKIPWRRERLPTPVFWPEEFHGVHGVPGEAEVPILDHLMWRANSLEKTLILWKIESKRRRYDEVKMSRG